MGVLQRSRCSSAASTSQPLHNPLRVKRSLRGRQQFATFATATQDPVQEQQAPAAPSPPKVISYLPESFQLAPGDVSTVDRVGKNAPGDVFRCPGCTEAACQGPTGCAATSWRFASDGYLREILTARVYDVAVQTPLEEAKKLSEKMENTILLKREDLQPVFSFKLRGAYNKMAKLSAEKLQRGVITSSAGNHAQGVALAASRLGCKATICMPINTPEIKVANVRRLGGHVELVGESYQEAQAHALHRSVTEGLTFVAPYDDPYTIAGQGTIGDEILRQVSDPDSLDVVFVAIGGGGLIAGVAAYLKALRPEVLVIGVEPTGANAMAMSLAQGERVVLSKVDAFADGVAVKQVGQETFRLCRELVDGVVLVDNAAISAAIKDVFNETRSILEPAGAVAVAGAKAWLQRHGHKGKTVVAITSGANINFDRLRLVSELADVGAMAEAMLATSIPERPGAFAAFVDTAAAGTGASLYITEFKYRYSAGSAAHVLWSMAFKDQGELAATVQRLNDAGLATRDISRMEAAQVHLRHLVGGRARCYMGEVPDERIFQITFPERQGALRRFLDAISPAFNVTLFHYRNTGNRESQVLLGLQVPALQREQFAAASEALSGEFTFNEVDGEVRQVFDMFIQ